MINKFGFYNTNTKQEGRSPLQIEIQNIEKHESIPSKPPLLHKKQTYLKPEEFHPFQIPPNLYLADLHRKVSRFGKITTSSMLDQQNQVVCNCCGQEVKQVIDLNCEVRDISKNNEPLGYYFIYLKVMIVAFIAVLLVSGVYGLTSTIIFCGSNDCLYIYALPFPSSKQYYQSTNIILSIVSAFLIYPFIIYLFYTSLLTHRKIKNKITTVSDYCVLIQGVDHTKISDQLLAKVLGEFDVSSILYTHQIGSYMPLLQKRFLLQAKKNLFFKRGLQANLLQIQKEILMIDDKVLPFKNMINFGKQRNLRTDKIIVKFRSIESKQKFSSIYHNRFCKRMCAIFSGKGDLVVEGVPLFVQNIGQPQQLIWENLQISAKYKFGITIINSLISIIILGISFGIVIVLTHQQNQRQKNEDIVLSFVLSFIIEIINSILYILTFLLTEMQRRTTLTGKMTARIVRNVVLFFFNTTLVPFSLFLVDWYEQDRNLVLQYIVSLFLVSNFVSPFAALINVTDLYKLYYRRSIVKEGKDCLVTQLQANKAYQKFNFQLQLKYELLSQRIMNCCFYAAIFPEVVIITILGLTLDYWIQKWWLLKYSCMPKYSFRLGKMINRISVFFPCIYLLGYFANLLMLNNKAKMAKNSQEITVLYCFIISLIFSLLIFFSLQSLANAYIQRHSQLMTDSFSAVQRLLDYEDLNPTSFLHLDIQNRMVVQGRQQKFEHFQQFIIKKHCSALRRDTGLPELKRGTVLYQIKR